MKVLKFGGASVKDSNAVRNVFTIVANSQENELCIVFSAMGKTTNALEEVAESWITRKTDVLEKFCQVEQYHYTIAEELNIETSYLEAVFGSLKQLLHEAPPADYDEGYDRIVCFGEILSTTVISAFLQCNNLEHSVINAGDLIITDENFRNAAINWDATSRAIQKAFRLSPAAGRNIIITQGFIGRSVTGKSVTLGREGSDFSAAILAWALNAGQVIIWKDVPGVLNADPRYFKDTIKLDKISYRDAIELAYYGASVIHPKTIQPLQSKRIPLYVKSFFNPAEPGTLITVLPDHENVLQVPCYIFKPNQVLVSVSPRDFSFIAEDNLQAIFGTLNALSIHINVMQLSAISFSLVFDYNEEKVTALFAKLRDHYEMRYNSGLELITIRYYNQETIDKVVNERAILLEQKSRTTVQLVVSIEQMPL